MAYNKNYGPVGIFIMIVALVSLIAIPFAQKKQGADLDAWPLPFSGIYLKSN